VLKIGTVQYKVGNEIINANTTTPSSYEFYSLLSKAKSKNIKNVISEVSSHALSQYMVFGFIFDIAVFTNLTGDHLDYHSSMEDYFRAKRSLFTKAYANTALINIDDIYGVRLFKGARINKYSYGFNKDADVHVCHANYTLNGINAIISAFDRYIAVESTLIGKHNLYNIMASLTSAILAGISDNDIQKGIMQLKNVPGRLEKIEKDGIYFFVDYAHTDDALLNVLQSLLPFKKKRIIVVFGCGGNRDRTKRPRMGKIAKKFADLIILTNDNPRFEKPESIISDILKGIKGRNNVYIEEDRRKAIKLAYEFATTGDIILVAGKGHEDYQIMGNSINHFDDKEVILDIIGDPVEKH
jgi:UDP-N-acetylmuramoyl-L-alanyl-D-glutamate--2,6-diaminopimelate ligase